MSDRQLVLEAVQRMPEAASLADILDELETLASIREGLAQSERGEGVPHERVMAMLDAWISKSSGLRAAWQPVGLGTPVFTYIGSNLPEAGGVRRCMPARFVPIDRDTLCTFRREHQALLIESFVQVLQLAQQLKLLPFGQLTVAADGTKVLASADKHSAVSYQRARARWLSNSNRNCSHSWPG